MADVDSVEAARNRVATAYNEWLKAAYGTIVSGLGSRTGRRDLDRRIGEDGAWTVEFQAKALAWIPVFSRNDAGELEVSLPRGGNPNLLGGSLNLSAKVQGIMARILPAFQLENGRAEVHPYWEWSLVFVFPSSAAARANSTSGNSVEYDHTSGELAVRARGTRTPERYLHAGLFRLVPGDDVWSQRLNFTYDAASAALGRFLNVTPVAAPERKDEGDA
jgi:hypothetical protein